MKARDESFALGKPMKEPLKVRVILEVYKRLVPLFLN